MANKSKVNQYNNNIDREKRKNDWINEYKFKKNIHYLKKKILLSTTEGISFILHIKDHN